MKEDKIVIPAKTLQHLHPGKVGMVKLTPEAYNAIVDLTNECGMTLSRIASTIIVQAVNKDLIELERCFNERRTNDKD